VDLGRHQAGVTTLLQLAPEGREVDDPLPGQKSLLVLDHLGRQVRSVGHVDVEDPLAEHGEVSPSRVMPVPGVDEDPYVRSTGSGEVGALDEVGDQLVGAGQAEVQGAQHLDRQTQAVGAENRHAGVQSLAEYRKRLLPRHPAGARDRARHHLDADGRREPRSLVQQRQVTLETVAVESELDRQGSRTRFQSGFLEDLEDRLRVVVTQFPEVDVDGLEPCRCRQPCGIVPAELSRAAEGTVERQNHAPSSPALTILVGTLSPVQWEFGQRARLKG
jgi:hypothetical protein